MYMTHLASIVGPVFEHMQYRLEKSWEGILANRPAGKALSTGDCEAAASLAARGDEDWILEYYSRSGLFVGDLDAVTAEAAVEKQRVECTRVFGDVLQTALALKGDWALVLANLAKEETSSKGSKPSTATKGPPNRFTEGLVNADGTPKSQNQKAIDARKLHRVDALAHFLFLEHEQIAGFLTLSVIQCLRYPDTYTCRRMTRICHRMLETVAWHPRYTDLLGRRMFSAALQNIVTEPKWMVGVEWDVINVARDIYCRLVLGQSMQAGGQGAGLQQPTLSMNPLQYEQAKSADKPLQGGGILTTPSDLPRQMLASLPGISVNMVQELDTNMKKKRSAKDHREFFRDLLRTAADAWNESTDEGQLGLLQHAVMEESLLHNGGKTVEIDDIPEKLVTRSMMAKKHQKKEEEPVGMASFLFK